MDKYIFYISPAGTSGYKQITYSYYYNSTIFILSSKQYTFSYATHPKLHA